MGNSFEKVFIGNAGSAGGAGLDIDNVFSTFLYVGNGSTQTITNGIDLDGEGGLVWIKNRDQATNHILSDSETGPAKQLRSNETGAIEANGTIITSFNSTGFSLREGNSNTNQSGDDYVSWTWRKAPKFFDVITYTGTGSIRTVSHNLGSAPGMIIVKRTDATAAWRVYHRGAPENHYLTLNATDASGRGGGVIWNDTAPTDSVFTVGANNSVNADGGTFVAYLFAHNNNDGGFGPDGDQDIIKCGSYNGNTSTRPVIDLGFEPQWLMIKSSSSGTTGDNWWLVDTMRSFEALPLHDNGAQFLRADLTDAEAGDGQYPRVASNSTGFSLGSGTGWNVNNQKYIYMAIRRGPLAVPDDATKVFDIQSQSNADTYSVGFPTDLILLNKRGGSTANTYVGSRLTGNNRKLTTSTTAVEAIYSSYWAFDLQNSFDQGASTSSAWVGWHWKRAPGYFDAVAYTGTGSATTLAHNLDVVPEMMWVKSRSGATPWAVYHKDIPNTKSLRLDGTNAIATENFWNGTTPTADVFTVGANSEVNYPSGRTYIAYLFATAPGVSKVGIINHSNGTASNVDCGFSNGARFVLVKRSDGTGNWFVWDSVRGIVAGNDKRLVLNTAGAENTGNDDIDPLNAGFTWVAGWSTGYYIFYAIA